MFVTFNNVMRIIYFCILFIVYYLLSNDLFIWVSGLLGNILISVVVCMLYLANLEFRCLLSKFLGPSEFVAFEGTFYFLNIFRIYNFYCCHF